MNKPVDQAEAIRQLHRLGVEVRFVQESEYRTESSAAKLRRWEPPRYEWRVFRVLPFANGLPNLSELQIALNRENADGWETFQILPDCTVILRKEIEEKPEEQS